jgi:hypothetical protein
MNHECPPFVNKLCNEGDSLRGYCAAGVSRSCPFLKRLSVSARPHDAIAHKALVFIRDTVRI